MTSLQVDVDAAQALQTLDDVAERGGDPRPALHEIARAWERVQLEWFESRGRGTWPPNTKTTLDRKRANNQDLRVMHATNTLKDSLTKENDEKAVRRVRTDGLTFATKAGVQKLHERGVSSRKLPRRPIRPPLRAQAKTATATLATYVRSGG